MLKKNQNSYFIPIKYIPLKTYMMLSTLEFSFCYKTINGKMTLNYPQLHSISVPEL